jgi:hypothetical protein
LSARVGAPIDPCQACRIAAADGLKTMDCDTCAMEKLMPANLAALGVIEEIAPFFFDGEGTARHGVLEVVMDERGVSAGWERRELRGKVAEYVKAVQAHLKHEMEQARRRHGGRA